MSVIKHLLDALDSKDAQAAFKVLQDVSNNGKDTDLKEVFEMTDRVRGSELWQLLLSSYKRRLEEVCRCESPDTSDATDRMSLKDFKSLLVVAQCYCCAGSFRPPALLEIISISQAFLTEGDSSQLGMGIKSIISKISENWWINNLEGAEILIPQLLTYLLISSLDINGHDVDIKRLYSVRGGFFLLDFDEDSIVFTRDLILRCFVHPSFLKLNEGQKLLSFFLNLNQGLLVDPVCQIIRPQVAATGAKSVASAYGETLHRAWRDALLMAQDKYQEPAPAAGSSEEVPVAGDGLMARSRTQPSLLVPGAASTAGSDSFTAVDAGAAAASLLEESIQSFLRECVHASNDAYFKGLRRLLKSFHDVRRTKELDALLLRVYDPILWRSLRCAHAKVRAQAAIVFLDVFPLQHADGRAEDDDRILQKQFDLLSALLTDGDHTVRTYVVPGVCHILREYWEALPINTTHNILRYLVETLSGDMSCANVRQAVFLGLGELCEQPLAHGLLKQLLPLLKNSIHDKAEKVREAFIRVLCQIKDIRGMHFYEVVPVEHLLQRLAEDRARPSICSAMTHLLLNSFYPQQSAGFAGPVEPEQFRRCCSFIDRNPVAAESFYATLPHFIPIGNSVKLVCNFFAFLVSSVQQQQQNSKPSISTAAATAGATTNKRRRQPADAQQVQGERAGVAAGVAAVPSSSSVPYQRKMGLMRIVLRMLETVQEQMVVQVPSRDLLLQYFTTENTLTLMQSCFLSEEGNRSSGGDDVAGADSLHLLPIAFKIIAVSTVIRSYAGTSASSSSAAGKKKKEKKRGKQKNGDGGINAMESGTSASNHLDTHYLVHRIYASAWKQSQHVLAPLSPLSSGRITAAAEKARQALARAVVELLVGANAQSVLHESILQSLTAFAAAAATTVVDDDEGNVLPVGAAVDLLGAFDMWNSSSGQDGSDDQSLHKIFAGVRETCQTWLLSSCGGDDGGVDTTSVFVAKALRVWAGFSLRCDAERWCQLAAAGEEDGDEGELTAGSVDASIRFVEFQQVISWCSDLVLPCLSSPSTHASAAAGAGVAVLRRATCLLSVVLSCASDAVYLDMIDASLSAQLGQWMKAVLSSMQEADWLAYIEEEEEANELHSPLLLAVCRLAGLLTRVNGGSSSASGGTLVGTTASSSESSQQQLFVVLYDVLVMAINRYAQADGNRTTTLTQYLSKAVKSLVIASDAVMERAMLTVVRQLQQERTRKGVQTEHSPACSVLVHILALVPPSSTTTTTTTAATAATAAVPASSAHMLGRVHRLLSSWRQHSSSSSSAYSPELSEYVQHLLAHIHSFYRPPSASDPPAAVAAAEAAVGGADTVTNTRDSSGRKSDVPSHVDPAAIKQTSDIRTNITTKVVAPTPAAVVAADVENSSLHNAPPTASTAPTAAPISI
mmetsp:Transcript_24585/g.40997  ORF Transcript_24585/g.40997 Transcript_24585/m.40997 type:complete len:1409 (-) Transcript_24585:124-4350(-)